MAIIRLHQPLGGPFAELDRIRREFDRLFDEFTSGFFPGERSGVFPPVNVYEGKEHYLLTAELPGVDPSDVEITVTEDSLTIRGERKPDDGGESANYHRRERGSGTFRRVITLPDKVNPDKVEATSRRGILYVRLPKAEEVKPRQIQIKSA
jgi:HSP20 family protein